MRWVGYVTRMGESRGAYRFVVGKPEGKIRAYKGGQYCNGSATNKMDSLTLVGLQLDAHNSCLFTYNTSFKILYMFRALPFSSSGGLRHNCIYAASGVVTLCR